MTKEQVKLLLEGLAHCIGYSADENDMERTGDCTDCPLKHECNWTIASVLELCMDAIMSLSEERDRYWKFIEDMGCDSCCGDCDKCEVEGNDLTGWEWSGKQEEWHGKD